MPTPRVPARDILFLLAAISYFGWGTAGPKRSREATLRRLLLERGLEGCKPLRGRWELLWGPATFTLPFTFFTDNAMFLLRSRDDPGCLVAVVRGTNPVSGFDWLLEDFSVLQLVPWPYGPGAAPPANVSLGTWIGLRILQEMRPAHLYGAVPPTGSSEPEPRLDSSGLPNRFSMHLRLARARHRAADDLTSLRAAVRAEIHPDFRSLAHREDTLRAFLEHPHDFDLLSALVSGEEVPSERGRSHPSLATDLRSFLHGLVTDSHETSLHLHVIGHSLGGALAPALATWLAETQGARVPEKDRWDPHRRVLVHCHAFAGPTPGDAGFARRVRATLGNDRVYRLANSLDVVPYAWAPEGLRAVAGLYGWSVLPLPGLRELAGAAATAVEANRYTHIQPASRSEFQGRVSRRLPLYALQVVHQHMEAYLEHLGLQEVLSTRDLMPLARTLAFRRAGRV